MERIARLICKQENIAPTHLKALQGGQVNATFLLDDTLILRIALGAEGGQRLVQEANLLGSLPDEIPVPAVTALGEMDGFTYQIQHRVPGRPLHQVWTQLPTHDQNEIAKQLARSMQSLHQRTNTHFGLWADPDSHKTTWREHIVSRFRHSTAKLRSFGEVFPPQILDAVEAYFEDRLDLLDVPSTFTPALVHHDLWPGNILVNHGSITAILDFEFATWAPREYELVLIEQFCLYPNDFVEEAYQDFACTDFASYFTRLHKHYPALFAAPGLRKRLDLYHIEYVLSAYLNWMEGQAAKQAGLAVQPVAKVMNFLFEQGTRLFFQ